MRVGRRHAVGDEPALERVRERRARPTIISVKKTPIESTLAEFWNVASIPAPAPRCVGGRLFITPARVRRGEQAHADPVEQQDSANQP